MFRGVKGLAVSLLDLAVVNINFDIKSYSKPNSYPSQIQKFIRKQPVKSKGDGLPLLKLCPSSSSLNLHILLNINCYSSEADYNISRIPIMLEQISNW